MIKLVSISLFAVIISSSNLFAQSEISCSQDSDCVPIPEGCLGCLGNKGQLVSNKKAAAEVMRKKFKKCKAVVQKVMKKMKASKKMPQSEHHTCKLIPKCIESECMLEKPTDEDLKKMREFMEQARKKNQESNGAAQNGSDDENMVEIEIGSDTNGEVTIQPFPQSRRRLGPGSIGPRRGVNRGFGGGRVY